MNYEALSKISYGLYIVSSGNADSGTGYIANTVFQITSTPAQFVVSCNKDNYTGDLIKKHNAFSVSVLERDTPAEIFKVFGYKSGKDFEKFKHVDIKHGKTGVPIVLTSTVAYLEFTLEQAIDMGTHIMFVGKMIDAEILDDNKNPITYDYYRNEKNGSSPQNAPTYIDKSKRQKSQKTTDTKQYECNLCGYIYDNSKEPVNFNDLPEDWTCPVCGVTKSEFTEI